MNQYVVEILFVRSDPNPQTGPDRLPESSRTLCRWRLRVSAPTSVMAGLRVDGYLPSGAEIYQFDVSLIEPDHRNVLPPPEADLFHPNYQGHLDKGWGYFIVPWAEAGVLRDRSLIRAKP